MSFGIDGMERDCTLERGISAGGSHICFCEGVSVLRKFGGDIDRFIAGAHVVFLLMLWSQG